VSLKQSDDLVLLDAADTLSSFMANAKLDARAFNDSLCAVIARAARGRTDCTVRIYGQMVDILWKEGKRDLAIRLEMLWNQLANTQRFSLLCGYAVGPFYKDAHVRDVCPAHAGPWGRRYGRCGCLTDRRCRCESPYSEAAKNGTRGGA
jgi:hypothetical protein